ncbi:unnamed protein product [Cyprideis torosa]|uniref:Uncharacterized protein n=1 Tax=Cyprideis torosa TaxID=163714 RepID=A0A7R8ZIV3_9CRUS|nr:unnamed protein product [Cyprideis torosa]CAG0880828.1 unnamed protein product [Cyprideis torosa]
MLMGYDRSDDKSGSVPLFELPTREGRTLSVFLQMEGASASTDSLSRSSGSSSRKPGSSSHKSRSSLNGPISSLDKQNSQAAAALASLSSQFAAAMASVPASSSQKGNLHTSKPLGRGQSRPKKNTVASLLATRKASATSARDSPGPTGMGDSLTSPGFPLGTPGGDLKTHDPTTSALLIAAVSGTSSSTYPSSATPLEGEPGAEEDLDDTHSEGGDSSVAGSDMTSLSSSSAVPRKRRKTSAEDSVVQVPLVSGWRRETMIRSIQNSGIRGEVTYYSPDNKKFKQYPELLRYLERNGITNFGREHFSFSLRVIAGEYLYPTGDGNVLTLTAQEMEAQLEEMRAHTAVGNASRAEKMRERRREEKEIQHRIIEELKKDNRPVTEDEVARRIQEWKAERRHERELVREREREQRRQQMEEARRQREKERAEWAEQQKKEKEDKAKEAAKEKELKRQQAILLQEQAAQLYMQELTKQREYLLTQEMDRERRRQHMILIKALEGRKKAEEKEKRRREADREKQLQRDRRLQRRSFELEILRELRRGVDDMALTKDSKELPQLQRLPGLKLSGEAFADVQMIYEFLHNFGETLGFDMDSLPSLLHLQLAFLNQSSCEDELLSILTHLLVCAIEDPGIPHPNRHTTLFGQTLKQADITPANASEIMRIYLYANATGEVKALMGIAPDKKDIIVEKSPEFLEQAAQLYMQELTKQREYLLTQEMDRERRRQHMILIKALEGRKKAEEKEKRRREADREKQLQRDRRLQRRSFELEILRELRRGVDDMALTKDSKELPQLQRLPGLKLSGEAFADVQMIYEFLHNFGETLGFDMDSLPSLLHLQLAFLNQSSCEDELLSILTHLLVCAIEDPGIPHPNRHTTLFGQTLKQADITPANASEIMRIYLYANATGEVKALMGIAPDKKDIIVEKSPEFLDLIEENQAYQLSQLLVDRPYLSLSPEQKAKIVSYICHELLLNKAVVKQVDATVERLNSARRDKWAVEVRLRRARSASAHYRRTPVSSGKAPCAAAASLRAMSLAEDDLFLDDSSLLMTPSADGGAGGEKGAESDSEHPSVPVDNDRSSTPQATGNSASTQVAPPTPSSITETAGDEASVSSAPASCAATPQPSEESNKELEALEKQYETACRDLWDTQLQLRGLRLGEDRYKRTYWLCRRGGGILVEGMESGSPVEFGVGEMFGDTDDQEDEEESAVIKKEEVLSEGGVEAVKKEVDEPDEGIGMNGEEGPGSSSTGSDLKEGTTYLNGQKLSSTEEEEEMLRLWLQESAPAVKKKETPTANQGESKANGFSEEDDKKDVKMKKEEVDQPWFFLLPRSPCERNSLLCPPPSAEDDPEDSQQPQNGESEQLTAEEEADIRECLRTLAPASAAAGGGPPSVPIATLSKISSFATNPPRRDAVMAIVQTPPKRKKIPEDCRTGWWRITSADQLAALISSLNHHGIRERELKREIIRHKDTILAELEKPIPQESLLLPAADEEMEESDHLQPLVDSPRGPWARDVALRIDLGTLDQVLELEEKVHAASMQVKFWKPPPRLSTEDESRFRPSCEEGGGGGRGAGKLLNPVAVARERLLELETMIERRYITAPLGSSGGEILLHSINKAQNSIVTSSAVAASSPSPSPVTPCGGGASPVVSGSVEATPTGTEDGRDVERRSTPEKSVSSVGNSGSSETVTRALTQWREGLAQSTTAAQVAMALHMLQACIAWDKSIMKASCQFCHLGDNEAKLLLCDGCDRGYHTYCFKPEIEIPAGDWYCYECLNKATRRRHCLYCGGLGKNIASCDNCCKAYHADCHNPPLAKVPRGKWYCTSCASRNPRMAAVSAAAFSKRGRKPKTSTSGSSPSISSPAPAPSPSPLTQDKSPPPSVASNHSQSDDDSKKDRSNKKVRIDEDRSNKKVGLARNDEDRSNKKVGLARIDEDRSNKKVGLARIDEDRSNKKVSRDLGPLRTLLEELESHEDSWPFLLPVNTKQYKSREEFLFDVRLIFDNCETFNEDDSPVGKAGHNLRMAFESRWGEVMGTASPNANCSSNGSAPS